MPSPRRENHPRSASLMALAMATNPARRQKFERADIANDHPMLQRQLAFRLSSGSPGCEVVIHAVGMTCVSGRDAVTHQVAF
jgi:hypothetical protein